MFEGIADDADKLGERLNALSKDIHKTGELFVAFLEKLDVIKSVANRSAALKHNAESIEVELNIKFQTFQSYVLERENVIKKKKEWAVNADFEDPTFYYFQNVEQSLQGKKRRTVYDSNDEKEAQEKGLSMCSYTPSSYLSLLQSLVDLIHFMDTCTIPTTLLYRSYRPYLVPYLSLFPFLFSLSVFEILSLHI